MKSLKTFFILSFLLLSFLGFGQPRIMIDRLIVPDSINSTEVLVKLDEFKNISEAVLKLTLPPSESAVFSLIEHISASLDAAITFENTGRELTIVMKSIDGELFTIPSNTTFSIIVNNLSQCNNVHEIKVSSDSKFSTIENNVEKLVDYFPTLGFIIKKCGELDFNVEEFNFELCMGEIIDVEIEGPLKSGEYFFGESRIVASDGTVIEITLFIAVVNIINPSSSFTELAVEICNGDSFTLGNQTYTQTGNYQEIFTTAAGCDSIVNLALTVESFQGITCMPPQIIYIPEGFTHFLSYLELPELSTSYYSISPESCMLEEYVTFPPLNKIAYGLGQNNYDLLYKKDNVQDSCVYTVNIEEGIPDRIIPEIAIEDAIVTKDDTFSINLTVSNFDSMEAVLFNLFWDTDYLDIIDVVGIEIEGNRINLNIENDNISTDFFSFFSNQPLTLPNNSIYLTIRFKANNIGETNIKFFDIEKNYAIELFDVNEFKYNAYLKEGKISIRENCTSINTSLDIQICQGENYILNNQAYNQAGIYQEIFTTSRGCDSIVQLSLEVLSVPSAITDTFNTKENEIITFDVTQNDIIPADVNWQTAIITPPHVGQLSNLGNGQFSYEPRFSYTGSTTFEYQICNEVCLPEGCTTTEVMVNIQGEQLGIDIEPTPLPQPSISQTSKIQLPNPSLQEGELIIFNIYGQQIENSYFFNDVQQQLWNLQQSELPAGIYFYVKRAKGSKKIVESGKIIAIGR